MFGKKKAQSKRDHSGKNLAQYGLFDIPTDLSFEENGEVHSDRDSDLEAELAALAGGGQPKRAPRKKKTPAVDLDAMVSESMRDIPSDEEMSADENDPDLLNELSELTGVEHEEGTPSPPTESISTPDSSATVTLLQQRLKLYEAAETHAKEVGETSRARRFMRGIKTLKDLIKQANSGHSVNPDDIPPEVTVNIRKPDPPPSNVTDSPPSEDTQPKSPPVLSPSRVAPPPPRQPEQQEASGPVELTDENKQLLQLCNQRRNEYKIAAVTAKKAGDAETALTYVKVVKAFEAVIKAVESGQTVDVSDMPGPPPPYVPKKEENTTEKQENKEAIVSEDVPSEGDAADQLITAGSLGEALQQRLDVYKKQEEAAREQNNSSKARRMGRIVKQFEQAIKLHNAGKPVPLDELPTPPGYAPLPGTAPPAPENAKSDTPVSPIKTAEDANKTVSLNKPTPPPKPNVHRVSGNHVPTSRAEKQVILLLARQKEFKIAALNAKKKGELEQAKEFLRTCKGFDPLIEASRSGLPVDISSLPVPPSARSQLENEYELVMAEECTEDDTDRDVLTRLESQLNKQLKMCLTTRDHNKTIGDVAGMNRFEQLALSVSKDLDLIRLAKRTANAIIPKFHYETREFAVVKTFTELNDNDFELTIVRGINYNCSNPKDIDTYVKFEFPYPQEEPYRDRTSTVKNTNNPEYNAKYTIAIQRSARTCLRVFKRHSVKFEVFSKGGFFRSDSLVGTVSVKLQPLETQCEVHDSFDIMDGRKKTGGKLEVKMRVRNPMASKQVEQLSEKWLVIDH